MNKTKVFKFGGASVKDADGVKNLTQILEKYNSCKLLVVVSAMGKTTNALEELLSIAIAAQEYDAEFLEVKDFHYQICEELFAPEDDIFLMLQDLFDELEEKLEELDSENYDFHYDQVVSMGEILSTQIVNAYLESKALKSVWVDARQLIKTNSNHRAALVQLEKSESNIQQLKNTEADLLITQGFIASNNDCITTTLGREGSDYSAALMAWALNLDELVIWKDVDGVYNADPKVFKKVSLIPQLSYKEAVELAFFGASIIHPKTIQPLRERKIKLKVKSFYHPEKPGTLISEDAQAQSIPSIIVKPRQLLLSMVPHDFSFTDAANMSQAFAIVARHQHQINLIQNSAISFSLCLDDNPPHFQKMLEELKEHFKVRYNRDQVLVTIRHYHNESIDKIYDSMKFKMEQRNRSTYQVLMGEEEFKNQLLPLID